MKKIIRIFIIFLSINLSAQNLKVIKAEIVKKLDFSEEAQKNWKKAEILMYEIQTGKKDLDKLSQEELEIYQKYDETFENIWDVIGDGCSWYCGAGNYKVKTTSELKPNNKFDYKAENLTDFSYQTAWVEGVKGYGIGETIEFSFPPTHPRITEIIIVNGYVKSYATWKNNSRVKKLKMYVNNKPYAILELQDIYAEQIFRLENPLGYSERNDFEKLKQKKNWTIKFEILEVYKGDKYDDTAITEIYFDGLDVHCLAKGTKITMSNGSVKNIEDLRKGDYILSYNTENEKFEKSKVLELATTTHINLSRISCSDGTVITCTKDHPFLTISKNWVSINPIKTEKDYKIDNVNKLKIGTKLLTSYGQIEVVDITKINSKQKTFTIVKLEKNKTFIANGIITGIEELRVPTIYIAHSGVLAYFNVLAYLHRKIHRILLVQIKDRKIL